MNVRVGTFWMRQQLKWLHAPLDQRGSLVEAGWVQTLVCRLPSFSDELRDVNDIDMMQSASYSDGIAIAVSGIYSPPPRFGRRVPGILWLRAAWRMCRVLLGPERTTSLGEYAPQILADCLRIPSPGPWDNGVVLGFDLGERQTGAYATPEVGRAVNPADIAEFLTLEHSVGWPALVECLELCCGSAHGKLRFLYGWEPSFVEIESDRGSRSFFSTLWPTYHLAEFFRLLSSHQPPVRLSHVHYRTAINCPCSAREIELTW